MNLKGILQHKSDRHQLFIFILIVFISSLFGTIFSAVVVSDVDSLKSDLLNPENISQLKIMQLITSVFIFIVPPFIYAYLLGGNIFSKFGFTSDIKRQSVMLVVIMMLFVQPFVAYSMQWNISIINYLSDVFPSLIQSMKHMEESVKEITTAFLKMENTSDLMFNLFLIALIPAIGEELFFRGVIQKKLQSMLSNPHIAIIVTAFVFSAIHMQFFGFLPRFFLGILLGYLFYFSKNLWMSVLAHFINNAVAVLLMYSPFSNKLRKILTQMESFLSTFDFNELISESNSFKIENTEVSFVLAFLSVLVVLFFIYLFQQINNKEEII